MPRKGHPVPREENFLDPGTEERPSQEMSSYVPFLDGVVLVDPDYLKDRKGTGPQLQRPKGRWGSEMGWH